MFKTVNGKTMLEQTTYKVLKSVALVLLPASSAAYFALSQIWGLPDTTQVIGSIAVAETFLGSALHLSSSNYYSSGAAHDGTVALAPTPTGSALSLTVDPADIVAKDSINLKVVPASTQGELTLGTTADIPPNPSKEAAEVQQPPPNPGGSVS